MQSKVTILESDLASAREAGSGDSETIKNLEKVISDRQSQLEKLSLELKGAIEEAEFKDKHYEEAKIELKKSMDILSQTNYETKLKWDADMKELTEKKEELEKKLNDMNVLFAEKEMKERDLLNQISSLNQQLSAQTSMSFDLT